MLAVTAVGEYLAKHWVGEPIKETLVRDVLLLHDLGNIVKFKRPFLGELEEKAEWWECVQSSFIKQFGSRATSATLQILKDLGADTAVTAVLADISPDTTGQISLSLPEARLCALADMSVTPAGVEGFEARMKDLSERYPTKQTAHSLQLERANAQYVQSRVSVSILELPRTALEARARLLQKTPVAVTIPENYLSFLASNTPE